MIVGLDEVGRGCWAGPLVAGAVLLPDPSPISGLRDSKKLSARQREILTVEIELMAPWYGLGWVSPAEVDKLGMTEAVATAMRRALRNLQLPFTKIIIDGSIDLLPELPLAEALVRADDSVPAVSAASIIAKVARDRYMADRALEYPGYGFEKHVGYGTALHRAALTKFGITPLHRRSFKPIAALI